MLLEEMAFPVYVVAGCRLLAVWCLPLTDLQKLVAQPYVCALSNMLMCRLMYWTTEAQHSLFVQHPTGIAPQVGRIVSCTNPCAF